MIFAFLIGLAVGAVLQNKLRNWAAKQRIKYNLPPQFDEDKKIQEAYKKLIEDRNKELQTRNQ